MRRSHLFALAACLLVAPAVAQVTDVRPIQRPVQISPKAEVPAAEDPNAAKKVMTYEEAIARIARLNQEKRELNGEKRELDRRLKQALADLEAMTRPGGRLVRAYCKSDTLSVNTAGASENCADSGYMCAPVEGTCHRKCNVTTQCASGFVCDTGAQRCVRP